MLRSLVEFLSRSGGTTTASLRQLAHTDPTSPARLVSFIERRLQQYLTACAAADHIDKVSVNLFSFHATRQQLEDGVSLYRLCVYLQSKLTARKMSAGLPPPSTLAGQRGGQPDDVITNPLGRLTRLIRQDNWQVFLDRAADAPSPTCGVVTTTSTESVCNPVTTAIHTFH